MYEITFRNIETNQRHIFCSPVDSLNLSDAWLTVIKHYGDVVLESVEIKESRYID